MYFQIKLWPRSDMQDLHLNVIHKEVDKTKVDKYEFFHWLKNKIIPGQYKVSISQEFLQNVMDIIEIQKNEQKDIKVTPKFSTKRKPVKSFTRNVPSKTVGRYSDKSINILAKLSAIEDKLSYICQDNIDSEKEIDNKSVDSFM